MKLTQIRLFFRLIRNPRIKKNRKIELWERDLSPYQRFKINARIAWRRFDTQTRGMGLFFVMIMAIMLIINVIPFIFMQYIKTLENQPYKDALNTACLDKEFYNWNFKSCESMGVRP